MPKGIPNKKYTGQFKQIVVETLQREKLSYCEAARNFEVGDGKRVASWERIYLEEGAEGLHIERRGRRSTAGCTQKGHRPKLDKRVEEDLIPEVQLLRAEVAYLKNLHALVSERVRRENGYK